ncbi:sugar binding protein [Thermococcus onnurineus NA1]|uniref:Sugar binding protein n=1 Tax=Thermococcus onnurineus (strain NA1) TaxID=523850 RepID=B6YUP5_THEON|nr:MULTISPECIES: BMP family ABC transporter substrate-binding protein [Thermococcus]ACJ16081.1 sugar binding protein [Thermococcus onnurineus NA1]NJE46576.1 BMP family ABC transporter substrate-binding protein [Thermococcus sp. GR7]NJE79071.1 BMP family ABC transporter substrate-binding protein [Thermococcus sp. GR4]NJF23593.1 BMP family ABC transporter substrate-binding protein [Thermococcus sp. GR5]
MKKWLSLFLIGLLAISVVASGCIGGGEETTTKGKIAIVYDVGGRGDLSFNDMAYLGASKAAKDFNLELVEVQSAKETDYLQNLETLAQQGEYEIIIAVGFMMTDAVKQVAAKYPDQKFAIIDGFDPEMPDNVMMILFKENEGSALVGALAGMVAANDDKDKVGIVLGMEIPVLYKFEAGYRFGVSWGVDYYNQKMSTNKKVDVIYQYTGTFTDAAKGKAAAQAQLQQGAWVIYQVAGGTGVGVFDAVAEALKAQGKDMGPPFAIGVDSAQDWIKPGIIIASMMKRVDVGVYTAVKAAVEGTFKGGVVELGLKEGGVGISTIEDVKEMFNSLPEDTKKQKLQELGFDSEDQLFAKLEETRKQVPDWVWQAIDELKQKIINGEIQVPAPMDKDGIEKIRNANDWTEMMG